MVAVVTETIIIRPATAADAADIAGMINAAFAPYQGRLKPGPSALKETAETIAPQLALPGGGAVAVRVDGTGRASAIAGTVLFKPEADDLYFGRLAVPQAQRGHGIAGALIRFVEDEARRRACAGIVLGVRIALPENQRLFAYHGFVEVSRHAHDGYPEPTWIRMRKRLTSG